MKKFLLLSLIIFWGCSKDFDEVIDAPIENYQVKSITGVKKYIDLKTPGDSLLNLRVTLTPESNVRKVYYDVKASDNSFVNSSPVEMLHTGNNVFESEFILKRENPIGNYSIIFSVTGINNETKQVGVANFYFNNGQDNVAPVIFNALIEPDTLVVNDTTLIQTSVQVADSNGLNDIQNVFFIVTRPDGTSNNLEVNLFDDGSCCPLPPFNQVSGDAEAGDGIFSLIIQVDQTNQKGIYHFRFQARDQSNALSNIIDYEVLIQ